MSLSLSIIPQRVVSGLLAVFLCCNAAGTALGGAEPGESAAPPVSKAEKRKPTSEEDLRYWLENMVAHHRYTVGEVAEATGLETPAVVEALERFRIAPGKFEAPRDRLRMLPYPGGRHPRLGFLDGAVDPQRESKISVFTPWDPASYVVVDLPEAIWSNLGLTYLAHTHVPTIWTEAGVSMDRLEWRREGDAKLKLRRLLPNGIAFSAVAVSRKDHIRMRLELTNGTGSTLTDLRVQMCVMLGHAAGFEEAAGSRVLLRPPFAAARSATDGHWIISAWEPIQRTWANPPVPCVHADPQFPDCEPGATVAVNGWMSFYEGTGVESELDRIAALNWAADFAEERTEP